MPSRAPALAASLFAGEIDEPKRRLAYGIAESNPATDQRGGWPWLSDIFVMSVEKIEMGSVLAHAAGDTMADIVSSVQRVTSIMAQIASASTEQETGIGEINSAIADMDNVTQQNAALVEEAAATAESVHHEATNLMKVVGFFKVDESAAVKPSPSSLMDKPVGKVFAIRSNSTPPVGQRRVYS